MEERSDVERNAALVQKKKTRFPLKGIGGFKGGGWEASWELGVLLRVRKK